MTLIKKFFKKYSHVYSLLIGLILLLWFNALEHYITVPQNVMYSKLDDYIPFSKFFVIPYLFWFLYIGITMTYFFFRSKDDFIKLSMFLYIGMSICYIVYMIYPNGQNLRPVLLEDDFLTNLVRHIYVNDTSTNCFPSIHVINSIAVHVSILNYDGFKNKRWLKMSSLVTAILICMSTVALKQHSIVDVFAGIGVSAVLYVSIYRVRWSELLQKRTGMANITVD